MKNPRSPLKDRPLRLPGQSLSEERKAIWDDKLEPWAILAVFFVCLTGLEWYKFLTASPPNPIVYTVVAGASVVFAVWRIWRARPRLKQLRQGIEGERAVGRFLERLRADGYHVFHDVIGPASTSTTFLLALRAFLRLKRRPGASLFVEMQGWSLMARA